LECPGVVAADDLAQIVKTIGCRVVCACKGDIDGNKIAAKTPEEAVQLKSRISVEPTNSPRSLIPNIVVSEAPVNGTLIWVKV
jgi:hypothetical protein